MNPFLSVVTMFFTRTPLRKPYQAYKPEHVNTILKSLSRNITIPHELVCVTDQPKGIDPAIKIAPLRRDLVSLGNAYPKVALFQKEPPGINCPFMLFVDLDTVSTGNLDAEIMKGVESAQQCCFLPEFITAKRAANRNAHYNTSIFVIKTGAFSRVWDRFNPATSPQFVRRTGKVGSDQVWISETLGGGMPTWEPGKSILSYKYHVRGRELPPAAKLVCFHGQFKPWDSAVQAANPWILQHWKP